MKLLLSSGTSKSSCHLQGISWTMDFTGEKIKVEWKEVSLRLTSPSLVPLQLASTLSLDGTETPTTHSPASP